MNFPMIGPGDGNDLTLVKQSLEQGHPVAACARNSKKVQMTHTRLHLSEGDGAPTQLPSKDAIGGILVSLKGTLPCSFNSSIGC